MSKDTQNYIVTKKGVNRGLGDKKVEHKIGDTLKLTEDQAAGLVGKVKLKGEGAEPSKTVKELTKINEQMDTAGKDLAAKLAEAQAQLGEQATQLDALNTQTVEQASQIGKLTTDLAAATKAK